MIVIRLENMTWRIFQKFRGRLRMPTTKDVSGLFLRRPPMKKVNAGVDW